VAVHKRIVDISGVASGDLSTNQFRLVYQTSTDDQVAVLANDGTAPAGVLLNKPAAAGRAARIAGIGSVVKCEAGAAITAGARVSATVGGRAITAVGGTNAWSAGIARSNASGSAAYFELEVSPGRGVQ